MAKLKNNQILLNSRWFQATAKLFTEQNIPILTWINSPHIINLLTFPFSGWHLSLVWRHYRQSVQAFNSWSQCYKNFFLRCQLSSSLFSLICNLTVRSTHRYLSEVDCWRHISWQKIHFNKSSAFSRQKMKLVGSIDVPTSTGNIFAATTNNNYNTK